MADSKQTSGEVQQNSLDDNPKPTENGQRASTNNAGIRLNVAGAAMVINRGTVVDRSGSCLTRWRKAR